MSAAELIARTTVWLALFLYAIGEILRLRWRGRRSDGLAAARWLWTIGCFLYLVHVIAAFGVFHDWSHSTAYEFTAELTEKSIGWHWGGGLFINYLFTAVWLMEIVAWWASPARYRNRVGWVDVSVRVFFAFMIINGAIVFVEGWRRLLGLAIVVLLLVGLFTKPVRRPEFAEVTEDDLLSDE